MLPTSRPLPIATLPTPQPPSWPPSLQRAQAALQDDAMDADEIVRCATGDARLVMRIFAVANSPFFDHSGHVVSELRGAVRRLGVVGMRCALLASALALWRGMPRLHRLRAELTQLSQGGATVAAHAWLIASHRGGCDPAEALLAGLMHNVGKLALLGEMAPSQDHGESRRQKFLLMAKWHALVGARIATQWSLPERIVMAIQNQSQVSLRADDADTSAGASALTSVLAAAIEAARTGKAPQATAQHLARNSDLPFTEEKWCELLGAVTPLRGAAIMAVGD